MERISSDEERNLQVYLVDIAANPLLNKTELIEQFQMIETAEIIKGQLAGDEPITPEQNRLLKVGEEAFERVFVSNLRLVVSIAKRYPTSLGVSMLDNIQNGALGLEHAIRKYDWTKGFTFATYATFWVRQAISRGFEQQSATVKVNPDLRRQMRNELRDRTEDELSPELREAYDLTHQLSLDGQQDDDFTLYGVVEDRSTNVEHEALDSLEREVIAGLIRRLGKEHEEVVSRWIGLGYDRQSQQKISDASGLSPHYVRKYLRESLGLLKTRLIAEGIGEEQDLVGSE